MELLQVSAQVFCLEKNLFTRETPTEILALLQSNSINEYDAAMKIVGSPSKDALTMSMYLYEFIPEKTIHSYKAYLSCKKLFNCELFVTTKDNEEAEKIRTSFEYAPVLKYETNAENKFHFQIFAKDEGGNRIPRDPCNGRTRRIVQKIIHDVIANAVVKDLNEFEKWNLEDTESLEQFKET